PNPPLDLVTDSVEAVSPIAQNKNIAITISVPADVPQVDVDADMIRRVLVNMVENAIKFTPPGGKIQVGAQREKQWIKFRVKDTGPGIPYPEQERIFEKFTRLRIKDGPRGLGLGLAFCRLAIIGHGGRIWVESEPGSGSSFIFTLPVAEGS
ncbi:MAG TPA: ATP-binding protein, partial [Anaerolineales bacterium]